MLGECRNLNLNVMQAAIQSLIDKLEPLFPEIAGMTVSSDGLREAIHGCELRLVHAYEAVLVRRDHTDILCIDLLLAVPQSLLVAYASCARSCGMPACGIAMGTNRGVVCNTELIIKHAKCRTAPVFTGLYAGFVVCHSVLYRADLKHVGSTQAVWCCT